MAITLKYLNCNPPVTQVFESPTSLLKEVRKFWDSVRDCVCPNHSVWEYLENTRIYFGEHAVSLEGDNSTFVEGYRREDGSYQLVCGVPAKYKTYTFANARSFFRNGQRLKKLVDRVGTERFLNFAGFR